MVSKAASPRNTVGLMSGCLVLKSFNVGSKAKLLSQQEICLHLEILISFQQQYQDGKQYNPCCRNQWNGQYQVHWW